MTYIYLHIKLIVLHCQKIDTVCDKFQKICLKNDSFDRYYTWVVIIEYIVPSKVKTKLVSKIIMCTLFTVFFLFFFLSNFVWRYNTSFIFRVNLLLTMYRTFIFIQNLICVSNHDTQCIIFQYNKNLFVI